MENSLEPDQVASSEAGDLDQHFPKRIYPGSIGHGIIELFFLIIIKCRKKK